MYIVELGNIVTLQIITCMFFHKNQFYLKYIY